MTVHLQVLREDLAPELDRKSFAQAVNNMHGFPQPLTEQDIASLENPQDTKKFPRDQVEEICLYLACRYRDHVRNIEPEDIPGLAARIQS